MLIDRAIEKSSKTPTASLSQLLQVTAALQNSIDRLDFIGDKTTLSFDID